MTALLTMTRKSACLLAAAMLAIIPLSPAHAQDKAVRVLRSAVGTFQALYIAEEQGYFKEAGLDVQIAVGGPASQMIPQILAGQADIMMSAPFNVVTAIAQGVPVSVILNIQDHSEIGTTGLLVPPGSPIKTIADLKGKKIGIPGAQSTQGLMLASSLGRVGLSLKDVTLVNLPFEAIVESAENGNVDAATPLALFYPLAKSRGFTEVKEAYAELKGTPAVVFSAGKEWLAANTDTVAAFNAAMIKAYDYANANPEAVRAVDRAHTNMPPDYIANRDIPEFVAEFQRKSWAASVAEMAKYGFISRALNESEYVWEGAPD